MSEVYDGTGKGSLSHFRDDRPNAIIFSCLPGTEIMRLDLTGMTYKGQRIEDGGEAHRAFLETMRVLNGGAGLTREGTER